VAEREKPLNEPWRPIAVANRVANSGSQKLEKPTIFTHHLWTSHPGRLPLWLRQAQRGRQTRIETAFSDADRTTCAREDSDEEALTATKNFSIMPKWRMWLVSLVAAGVDRWKAPIGRRLLANHRRPRSTDTTPHRGHYWPCRCAHNLTSLIIRLSAVDMVVLKSPRAESG